VLVGIFETLEHNIPRCKILGGTQNLFKSHLSAHQVSGYTLVRKDRILEPRIEHGKNLSKIFSLAR